MFCHFIIEDRLAATLLPIIVEHIPPGFNDVPITESDSK